MNNITTPRVRWWSANKQKLAARSTVGFFCCVRQIIYNTTRHEKTKKHEWKDKIEYPTYQSNNDNSNNNDDDDKRTTATVMTTTRTTTTK